MPPLFAPFVQRLRQSLRAQLALSVACFVLLTMCALSSLHYLRERQLTEDQARSAAVQLSQTLTSSLRHTMMVNDREMLDGIIHDISTANQIARVQLVDLSQAVTLDSSRDGDEAGETQALDQPGCSECHARLETLPVSAFLTSMPSVLRVAAPILNGPECYVCHLSGQSKLGVLLLDVSLAATQKKIMQDLQVELAISVFVALLTSAAVYWLVHYIGIRRLEIFRKPLEQYARGDFAVRLPAPATPPDELGVLALTFNQMADQLEEHTRSKEALADARQRAVVEERERIGRELHDGLAQLLGYVSTKATAVRLLMHQGQPAAAEKQLIQLEQAARDLFVDVREAILSLKLSGLAGEGLSAALTEYADKFRALSGLPVEVVIAPELAALRLDPEIEWQLFRIVQEALTNVRKHAAAGRVRVDMQNRERQLQLMISDDGQGFSPQQLATEHRPHFGLSSMRERAEAIGARFQVDSQPNAGTRVTVALDLT